MPDTDIETQEDTAPEDPGGGTSSSTRKGRSVFRNVRRELTEDELSNPAVKRMLLGDIERLEDENSALKNFENRYHEADKETAVLKEKLKNSNSGEILSSVCLMVGSALLGLAPAVIGSSETSFGWVGLAFAVVLITGGVFSKVMKRR